MTGLEPQTDLLQRIPSPSTRLWVGLCTILAIFLGFAIYAISQIRWLEGYQVNVVQKNRKASLQLLRLQNDAYLLAISVRDMTGPKYPIRDWHEEFTRLRNDMENALSLEEQFSVSTPATIGEGAHLRAALDDFWRTADRIFSLAQTGHDSAARILIQSDLEVRRTAISQTVARLLVLNDQAQAGAAARITNLYGSARKDILVLIGALFLLAVATGLYTFQANRKTFERLQRLAEILQAQSGQLRDLSWKLIEVQEETLRQVARDLHDEFGQILTAIGVMLGRAAQKELAAESEFVRDVEKVKAIVEETLETVRDSSQVFRPAILDDFGLPRTLEWLAAQFSRQTGIDVHFEQDVAEGFCPREDAIHLYRIVQEGLNNVARHAKAREARVKLREDKHELALEISDRGAGFSVNNAGNFTGGSGLMGMRERASHLGGSFAVQSAPGGGTVITVKIPVRIPSLRPTEEKAD